jgi:hypothetical protein
MVSPLMLMLLGAFVAMMLIRPAVAFILGRSIGRKVLAGQPDRIQLLPASPSLSRHEQQLDQEADALVREGFRDAGWFTVVELQGVVLRMLAHEGEQWLAVLYDHPSAGTWCELIQVFADGTRRSFTSSRPTGLVPTPGRQVTHFPGFPAAQVLQRARLAPPTTTPVPMTAAGAAAAYEQGFAEVMAARKAQGISRKEVVRVAMKPPRAA